MKPFHCKQFSIYQENASLKVGTDAVLLGTYASFTNPTSILDIGTGTGILALMMAQKYPCPIYAIDIDEGSITDAHMNFSSSTWNNRLYLEKKDVQEFALAHTHSYDGIICNPPFFSKSLKNPDAQKMVARHDVMLTPQILFTCAAQMLRATGSITIIIPYSEKELFCQHALEQSFYLTHEILIYPFEHSTNPNRTILTFSLQWSAFQKDSIAIRDAQSQYTKQFIEQTKDFYISR